MTHHAWWVWLGAIAAIGLLAYAGWWLWQHLMTSSQNAGLGTPGTRLTRPFIN